MSTPTIGASERGAREGEESKAVPQTENGNKVESASAEAKQVDTAAAKAGEEQEATAGGNNRATAASSTTEHMAEPEIDQLTLLPLVPEPKLDTTAQSADSSASTVDALMSEVSSRCHRRPSGWSFGQ